MSNIVSKMSLSLFSDFSPSNIIYPQNSMSAYVFLSFLLFSLSIFSVINNRKNIVIILASLELIFLAAMINFVAFSVFSNNSEGQILAMFLLAVSAIKISIGLGIAVVYFRKRNTLRVDIEPDNF